MNLNKLKYITIFFVSIFLIISKVHAQDDRSTTLQGLASALGTRTSPFNPPSKETAGGEVFVTDDGPGLDTGCTFNDDPEHPLIIDILVDRFVGEVNADGFLVNPDPLIAKGIIPSAIEVFMPAYDVDVNGGPPPERDEVFFNGELLGLLTGDNNIWKYNAFSVDIKKVRFPANPPAGLTPTPVANRVQINIDTLSSGDWCTAIDWVALVISINPEIGLTIEPKVGNKIRVNDLNSSDTIDVIYKQSFDADCNVTNDIDSLDEYPFSGSSTREAKLRTKFDLCPANSISPPEVKAEWNIQGTPLKGIETWTGLEGDVTIKMPEKVGAYTTELKYTIDGYSPISLTRKLFVTKQTPTLQVRPPRRTWYEKATKWASGEKEKDEILKELLAGLYKFGGKKWHYYDTYCPWTNMVDDDTATCKDANCFVFSEVFENMAATLGVGGLAESNPEGANRRGFVTNVSPSLDRQFPGNARSLGTNIYDRYKFGIHSLRQRNATYYDATFNGIYSSKTDFISYNLDGGRGNDVNGRFDTTDEGAKVYKRGKLRFPYNSWSDYEYATPTTSSPKNIINMSLNTKDIQFTGNVTFDTIDVNNDGIAERVTADIEVEILATGEYLIVGVLEKSGQLIANRPAVEFASFSETHLIGSQGIYTVSLTFSGEQIYQSGEDGPYDLVLDAIGENSNTTLTIPTPAYNHKQFGEIKAALISAIDAAVDENDDGEFDFIETTLEVEVRVAGNYQLQGTLMKEGTSIVNAGDTFALTPGTQTLKLPFPGLPIRRSGLDGPYEGVINIIDADKSSTIGSIEFITQAYDSFTFGAILNLDGFVSDQGIDTNGNGLFDSLQIDFGAEVKKAGTFLVSGVLKNQTSPRVVFTETLMTLSTGPQMLTLNFSGPLIHEQEIDGPYEVEVILNDPNTFSELDRVPLGQMTAAYQFTDFDPLGSTTNAISLTGNSFDEGIDTNNNSLFDNLRVEVEVQLTTTDFYEWSARLVDINGTEIGFDSRSATLNAGTTTIDFVFDGESIGQNGINGPFFVKGLLMFGQMGANLVSTEVATTKAYNANQFEGYTQNLPPVAQCQDQMVTANNMCQGDANIDNGSYDPDGDPINLAQSPIGPYELGDTLVTLTVTDDKDAFDTCQAIVTVLDQTVPIIDEIIAVPDILWPPNYQMTPVNIDVVALDYCDVEPSCKIIAVSSNQPDGQGYGNASPDWEITGDLTVNLRAEISGNGNGVYTTPRIYTIAVECIDEFENSSTEMVNVIVPLYWE